MRCSQCNQLLDNTDLTEIVRIIPPMVLQHLEAKGPQLEKVQPTVSYRMSRIRSTETGIEIALRRALFAVGLRYRKNYSRAPGRPDIAFVGLKIAVFCDSSFWHGRDVPSIEKRLRTNKAFWLNKINSNIARDRRVDMALREAGWKVLRFWDEDIENRLDRCVKLVCTQVVKRKDRLLRQPK
jgi:DNA mismatch endonuclease (patch repair protein)